MIVNRFAALYYSYTGNCDVLTWSDTDIADRQTRINQLLGAGTCFAQNGYFATVQMDEQLQQTGYGMTPLLLASLKLMGYRIQDVQCGTTSGTGHFHDAGLTNVVKIFYNWENANASATPFELVYAKLDMLPVQNTTAATQLSNFLTAIQSIGNPVATMMKCTGYIFRMSADVAPNGPGRDGQQLDSTILGNWVKNHTSLLLQDDTGIAMQCFSNWQMTVFGTYLGPTPLIEIPPDALTQVDNYLHNVASGDGHCGFHTESITNAALTINFGYGFQFAIEGCQKNKKGKHNKKKTKQKKQLKQNAIEGCPALPVSSDTQCLLPNGQWGGNGALGHPGGSWYTTRRDHALALAMKNQGK